MESVDLASWPRREIFEFFSPISNPFYALSFRLDVTKLRAFTKARGLSFYHSLIWLCTRAMERVEAFSYAIAGDKVVRLSSRRPSFTHLPKDSEQFQIVTLPCEGSLEDFCAAAKEKAESQDFFIDLKDDAAVRVPKDGLRVSSFEAEAYAVSEAHLHDRLGDPSDARSIRRHRIARSQKSGCPLPDLQQRLYIRQSSSGSAVIAFRERPQQHDPVPRFLELRSCDVTGLCHRDRV